MGLLDRLKKGTRGVFTSVKPAGGAAPAPADEVKRRLLAISGKGITTGEDDGEIVVAWAARIAGAGLGGGEYENLYRAIRVSLDSSATVYDTLTNKMSLVYPELSSGRMPRDGLPWNADELRMLRTWYCNGAFYDEK